MVYDTIKKLKKDKKKAYFCLLDPDKISAELAAERAQICQENGADAIMVGGSIMLKNQFETVLKKIQESVTIPTIIFPGLFNFVSPYADALFLLSVLSGRDSQMIIGEQVRAAPLIKNFGLEAIGTAYLLIESGVQTSVQYMSNSMPIPRLKNDIAVAHALAAEYLGFKQIYLEAGSGAKYPVSDDMIHAVSSMSSLPLIVGGGIRDPETAFQKSKAGANIIVTGTTLENEFSAQRIKAFSHAIKG